MGEPEGPQSSVATKLPTNIPIFVRWTIRMNACADQTASDADDGGKAFSPSFKQTMIVEV